MLAAILKRVQHFDQKRPVFHVLTTDFSYALINSVLLAFNGMNLFYYLELVYTELFENKPTCVILVFLNIILKDYKNIYMFIARFACFHQESES